MAYQKYIDVTDDKGYREIKKAYLKAVKKNLGSFKVGEYDFLTAFAKYFIEHVEDRRKERGLSIYNPK